MNPYKNQSFEIKSDSEILQEIGFYIKQERLKQNKTQASISKAAGISRSTLSLLERGETVTTLTLLQVLRVLDLLHLLSVFEFQQEISPVDYYKIQEKQRQRASNNMVGEEFKSLDNPDNDDDWKW